MNNKEIVKNELLHYLTELKRNNIILYGRKDGSKTFKIREICDGLIIVEYDSYPKHFVLEFDVLLNGIIKVLEQKVKIILTSDYASKIEYSTVNRSGTNNKTSVLTKFYYSMHRAFLKHKETENE